MGNGWLSTSQLVLLCLRLIIGAYVVVGSLIVVIYVLRKALAKRRQRQKEIQEELDRIRKSEDEKELLKQFSDTLDETLKEIFEEHSSADHKNGE